MARFVQTNKTVWSVDIDVEIFNLSSFNLLNVSSAVVLDRFLNLPHNLHSVEVFLDGSRVRNRAGNPLGVQLDRTERLFLSEVWKPRCSCLLNVSQHYTNLRGIKRLKGKISRVTIYDFCCQNMLVRWWLPFFQWRLQLYCFIGRILRVV